MCVLRREVGGEIYGNIVSCRFFLMNSYLAIFFKLRSPGVNWRQGTHVDVLLSYPLRE